MASSADPRIKQLRIKTGVLKRLDKEKRMYEREVIDQQTKVDQMKCDKKDEYDIRKQEEVLEESRNMVPDCGRRLNDAFTELQSLLDNTKDLDNTEEYTNAQKQIEVSEPARSS